VTTDELRRARHAWADAHLALDSCLTKVLPAALAADVRGGDELQRMLTPEQTHEISELYGRAIGHWAAYRELLRHTTATDPA
jgi:hypothetical protein